MHNAVTVENGKQKNNMTLDQVQRTRDILNVVLHKDAKTKFEKDNLNELIAELDREIHF